MSIVIRHSVSNALATASLISGGALSTVVVAHMLGPHSLGVVTYAMWLIGLAATVADLGVPSAMTRFLPEFLQLNGRVPAEDGGTADGLAYALLRAFGSAILSLMLVFAAVAAFLHFTDAGGHWRIVSEGYLNNPLFWLLVALGLGGQGTVIFALGLLRGRQEFGRLSRMAAAAAALQIGATAAGAWLFGIAGAIAGTAALGVAPALVLLDTVRRGRPLELSQRERVVRYCGSYWASSMLQAVTNTRTEIFFLARSWSTDAVALFSVSLTLANLAVLAPIWLTGSLLPHISHALAAGDRARALTLYRTSMRVMALMVMPACLGIAAIAPVLIPFLYGQSFAGAALPAAILVGAGSASALTSMAQIYMNAAERNGFNIWTGVLGAVAVITSGLLLIPAYGVLAAVLTRAGVQIATALASMWYVHRHLDAPAPFAPVARIICAALLCAAVARGLVWAIPGYASMLAAIPAGAVTYAVALGLFRCLTPDDVESLRRLTEMLPQPIGRAMSGAVHLYARFDPGAERAKSVEYGQLPANSLTPARSIT